MPIQIGARGDHGFDEPLGLMSDCHRRIEQFLGTLARIVADAGGAPLSASQRIELEAALQYFLTAAPRHTADEEQSLFPRLRACGIAGADVLETVRRLQRDHEAADRHHAEVHAEIRRWIADGHLDAEAAAALTRQIAALQHIYAEHITIEDQQVFPAAARLLSRDQLHQVGREMAARRSRVFPG